MSFSCLRVCYTKIEEINIFFEELKDEDYLSNEFLYFTLKENFFYILNGFYYFITFHNNGKNYSYNIKKSKEMLPGYRQINPFDEDRKTKKMFNNLKNFFKN